MNEDKSLKSISSVIAGIGCGIVMGLVMLLMMSAYHFRLNIMAIAAIGAVAIALPWCLDFLKTRGFSLWICELLMIVVSGVVGALYVHSVAQNEGTFDRLLELVVGFHGASLLLTVARLFFQERRGNR